jgi:membrane-associated phospholipid phosphatase
MVSRGRAVPLGGAFCAAAGFVLLWVAIRLRLAGLIHADTTLVAAARRTALTHPHWLETMRAVTRLGEALPITCAAVATLVALVALGRMRQAAFVLAVAALVLTRLPVREVVARPRPPDPLTSASGWAFPSGHTTVATAAALTLLVLLFRPLSRPWQRALLIAVVIAWPLVVGVSRVALVAHWPSDVLGAWLYGAACVALAAALTKPWLTPRPEPRDDHDLATAPYG